MGRRRKGLVTDLLPASKLEGGDIAIKPDWLLSDYSDWVWRVSKSATDKVPMALDFNFYLPSGDLISESEHAGLVKTVKYLVFYARVGATGIPRTGTAVGQKKLLGRLKNIVSWMLLNGITRFRRITEADIEQFKDEAVYGVAHLLRYPQRFKENVEQYKIRGKSLPTKTYGRDTDQALDVSALCNQVGIDMYAFRADSVCAYISQKVAHESGLGIKNSVADFDSEDAAEPAPVVLQETSIRRLYEGLSALYFVGTEVDDLDGIDVDPFVDVTLYDEVRNRCVSPGKTQTIPPRLALTLIDRSIRWVVDYGPELLMLRQEAERYSTELSLDIPDASTVGSYLSNFLVNYEPSQHGPGEPWPLSGFKVNHRNEPHLKEQPSLHTAVNMYLPMACAVVIMALSARREGEVLSLREDCLDRSADYIVFSVEDDQGEVHASETPAIESQVEKTLQSWDVFPTVELVVKAINLLKAWSEDARTITGDPKLFQWRWIADEKVSPFVTDGALRRFSAFVGADTDEQGEKWAYSDHQFRRFFAMVYFWRFEGASLTALSQYLRHFDLQMTTEYVRETIAGDAFDDIHREKLYEVMTKVFTRETSVSGAFGERIKRLRRHVEGRVRGNLVAVSPDKFVKIMRQEARDLVDSTSLQIHLKSYGACFGGTRNRQQLSQCVPEGERSHSTPPRPEQAYESTCMNCPNFMVWDEFLPNLRQTRRNANVVIESKHATPVVKAAASRMEQLVAKRIAVLEAGSDG